MDVENELNDEKPVGDELCRLCANTDKQLIPIFQEEGIEHNISEQIKKYLPIITVTKVDKLPLQICYQCTSTLLAWHNFFEQCRVADNRLREILSVDVEFNKDDESYHDYPDDFHDDFDDQPTISDRVCDNAQEKAILFDLTGSDTETRDNNSATSKNVSKSVTGDLDDNRFARQTTDERGSKDDVCIAPKAAAALESGVCGGNGSGGDALSFCECPKVADGAECSTCVEHRGRSARCQHCPMVFLSAERLASHMSSSHNERLPTSSSTRESANTKTSTLESDRKRRVVEKITPAPKLKVRKVEATAEPQEPVLVNVKDSATRTRVASFRCPECPKAYQLASSLKRHSAIHQRLAVFNSVDENRENGDQNGRPVADSTGKSQTFDVDPSADEKMKTKGNPDENPPSTTTAAVDPSEPKAEASSAERPAKSAKKKRRRSTGRPTENDEQPSLPMDTIVCSVCGETYEDESTFAEHQLLKHGGAQPAACDLCELQWPTPTLLRAHKIANHLGRQRGRPAGKEDPFSRWYVHVDGQKHLKCDQCNYNSLWHHKGRFLEHYRIHTGERPFTCDLCGKQFRTRSLMLKHITYVHEGVKEHACDLCGRCFSDKRYMEDHRRIHTGERPYVCDLCGKTFKQGASLFIHKELHKGLRKHACDMCGKRFTTSSSLHVHIKRHIGERNFVCAVCGKAFVDGKHLRDHSTVHSDERPFGCDLCGARFKLMKHLKQHGRTHKRNLPS